MRGSWKDYFSFEKGDSWTSTFFSSLYDAWEEFQEELNPIVERRLPRISLSELLSLLWPIAPSVLIQSSSFFPMSPSAWFVGFGGEWNPSLVDVTADSFNDLMQFTCYPFPYDAEQKNDDSLWPNPPRVLSLTPFLILFSWGNQSVTLRFQRSISQKEWDLAENLFLHLRRKIELKENIKFLPKLINQIPDYSQWERYFQKIHNEITEDRVKKVVLARRSTYLLPEDLSSESLLYQMCQTYKDGNLYYIKINPQLSWMGISPEHLFGVSKDYFVTQAVAGTVPIEKNGYSLEFPSSSIASPKDLIEHTIVVNFLSEQIQRLGWVCQSQSPIQMLRLGNLYHLCRNIEAQLPTLLHYSTFLHYFHPTPAIGGYPVSSALRLIHQHEPFVRGYYGGVLVVSCSKKYLAIVMIRMLVYTPFVFHIFTGSGIVKESSLESEWNELNLKEKAILSYFFNEESDRE